MLSFANHITHSTSGNLPHNMNTYEEGTDGVSQNYVYFCL